MYGLLCDVSLNDMERVQMRKGVPMQDRRLHQEPTSLAVSYSCSMGSSHLVLIGSGGSKVGVMCFKVIPFPYIHWSTMPHLPGKQFCSCWRRKSKVTWGVILMGLVMYVDRLRSGGGWVLKRCCLQIGFLRVRHPCWAISRSEQPLSYRMICY